MQLAGKQFWLGPARAGQVVRFWADCDLIHLFIGGTRVKTVRSHLTVTDLARAGRPRRGRTPARRRCRPIEPGDAVEVERVVSRGGTIALGGTGRAGRGDPRPAAGSGSGSNPTR